MVVNNGQAPLVCIISTISAGISICRRSHLPSSVSRSMFIKHQQITKISRLTYEEWREMVSVYLFLYVSGKAPGVFQSTLACDNHSKDISLLSVVRNLFCYCWKKRKTNKSNNIQNRAVSTHGYAKGRLFGAISRDIFINVLHCWSQRALSLLPILSDDLWRIGQMRISRPK